MADTLRAAAQAVVDRWDTPLWKDVPATAEYIGRLRASLAASAGSEPVAWPKNAAEVREFFNSDFISAKFAAPDGSPCDEDRYYISAHDFLSAINWWADFPHLPSPPEGVAGWISVDERLPESGTPVLLDIGKKYPIRAMWAPAKTLEASNDSDAVGDYDEATDTYYCPEGWYEWNQHEETHWFVTETPRAWMPLPASEEKEL